MPGNLSGLACGFRPGAIMDRPTMRGTVGKVIIASFILGLVLLRVIGIQSDPPLFYSGHSQAQLTDPYHLSFFARNAVLYGEWNPFDFHRWDVFRNSLISGVSYLFFSAFGVSRVTANLAAIVLHMGGLLLFLLGLRRFRDFWDISLVALLLSFNSSLFFYGRLPFLENGLTFLSGLTFFVFVRYHDRVWGQALTGALVALAALSGKLFGFVLLGPVLICLLVVYRSRVAVPILVTVAGLAFTAVAYMLVFYGGDLTTLVNYSAEHTVGMYGSPPGFSSLPDFFEMMMTYGGNGVWQFTPFLMLLTAISLVLVVLRVPLASAVKPESVAMIFCVAWILGGVLGLMPFFYRPMRYGLFLFLPMAAISAYAVRESLTAKTRAILHNRWISLPIVFIVSWHTLTQVFIFFSPVGSKFDAGTEAMFITAVMAAVITGVIFLLLRKRSRNLPRTILTAALALLLLAAAVYQGRYCYKGLVQPGSYLRQYNTELAQIVDGAAVLTGPYAPALTIDNELRGIIYMFGLSNVQDDLFDRFPITHIATDAGNWSRALEDFPVLRSCKMIVQMAVRERVVSLYRLPGAAVPMTDFERGVIHLTEKRSDSAQLYLNRFCDDYPQNLLGKVHLALSLFETGRVQQAVTLVRKLVDKHPGSHILHGFCQAFYLRVYKATRDNQYQRLSEHHKRIATQLNPVLAKRR